MTRRNQDPDFDRDEIEDDDPLGEQAFAEAGFEDGPDGGPAFSAPGMDDEVSKRPGGAGRRWPACPRPSSTSPTRPASSARTPAWA